MSSDLRSVLHAAATVPSIEANVGAAWHRGRRMRARRLAVSGLAVVVIVAVATAAVASIVPNNDKSPIAPATTPSACDLSSSKEPLPAWTDPARPPKGVPHLVSPDGNVVAVLFGEPLTAGRQTGHQNKILWIVRQPRGGQPLQITATANSAEVQTRIAPDSAPGEIYPSTINVPLPGCWHFTLAWNGHRSTIDIPYGKRAPTAPTSTTTIPRNTTSTTVAAGACRTANLSVTLGQPSGAAGSVGYDISFRNDGSAPCSLSGFPGVSFLDASGRQIGAPVPRNTVTYSTVDIAPGATAHALLVVGNPDMVSNPSCPASVPRWIRVFPPNETASVRLDAGTMRICATDSSRNYIDPVVSSPTQ
jgi:hypothetical protein